MKAPAVGVQRRRTVVRGGFLFTSLGLGLIAVLILAGFWAQRRLVREIEQDRALLASHERLTAWTVESHLADLERELLRLAKLADLKDAAVAADRRALQEQILPPLNRLGKGPLRVGRITFYTPDGTVYLRAHAPESYGENAAADRPLIAEAITARRIVKGLETERGVPYLWVATPLYHHGQFIGVLEMGSSFAPVANAIRMVTGAEVAVLLGTEAPRTAEASDAALFGTLVPLLHRQGVVGHPVRRVVAAKGKTYAVSLIPLKDFSDRETGTMAIVSDATAITRILRNSNLGTAAISFIGFVLTIALLSTLARDITERERAEEDLRKSEERFRLLAQASNDAVWDSDLRAGRIWRSEGMRTLFGHSEDAAQAGIEWWTEKIHPEDREKVTSSIGAVIEGAGSSWLDEYRFRRADGSYAYVSDRGYLLRDAAGQPLRMVGAMVDITERKRAEEAVWKANEAARVSREKSEFLSRMSHELRTPLNAILGFAQLMEMDVLGPEHRESLEHILKGGRHLLELVNEVLDIARIEAGRLAIALEPVSLNEVVREALDMIAPLAANVNVRVHAEGAGAPERHILVDRQRITQVLLNLLSNAVKYNHPGGSVTLAYDSTPVGQLRIKVSDTGPGIPPERMDRLFTPFERLGAEQTGVEGTGLGLALSKRLVEAMGGKLGVESTEGKGSTFWVEFPRAEPIQRRESKTQDVSRPTESGAPSDARTVLYIEDNLPNFELIRHLLSHRSKFRLLPAMQGRLGLDLAREHHPHLILLDLHLPDISGDEVLRRLRADPETSQIPVIMISADAMPAQIDRLLAAGASAYLTKPIDIKKFLALVNEILKDGPSPRAGR